MTSATKEVLQATLALAVPQWQKEIAKNYDYYESQRDELAVSISSEGDSILYRSPNTAQNFNKLACAVALMSFQQGGITVWGMHFQAQK